MKRKMRQIGKKRIFAVFAAVIAAVMALGAVPWEQAAGATVADTATILNWDQALDESTRNVGRIVTDKTVQASDIDLPYQNGNPWKTIQKGNSDFLVGLSAISSTATVKGQATIPLDIVFVMDTSGSMRYSIGDTRYEASQAKNYYDIWHAVEDLDRDLYIEIDGEKYRLNVDREGDRNNRRYTISYMINGKTHYIVDDEQNASLPEDMKIWRAVRYTKMEALKESANKFIDKTDEMNKAIDQEEQKHRIAIVSYDSSSEKNHVFSSDAANLKDEINSFEADGATRADLGMNAAKEVMDGNVRSNAKKVVIFFTDGEPTTHSEFSEEVANNAITTAKDMKANNTLIYSIGVFDDADPANDSTDDSNRFNAYMHAMSSNFPEATAWNVLGSRAADSDYYKAASDADELNAVFDNIFQEISKQVAQVPTEIKEGLDDTTSGYITFTDELGEYMQVDGFKSIVFANQLWENPIETTDSDNNIVTYTFNGSYNWEDSENNPDAPLYPEGEMKDVIIKVQKSNDIKQGDIVTVQIPASMIPLRHYQVDVDKDGKVNMSVDETYPIGVFYGVSLKKGEGDSVSVDKLLANPDQAMKDYMKDNMGSDSDENNVYFYSNMFDRTDKSTNITSEFKPSKTNSFYYFQADTPIYLDEECKIPAKEANIDETTPLYYQRIYYEVGEESPLTETVNVKGNDRKLLGRFLEINNNGELYAPAQAPRLEAIDNYAHKKEWHMTDTNPMIISPSWSSTVNDTTENENRYIINRLGNNGRLPVEVPGTLEVSKDVVSAPGHTAPADAEFEFTLELEAAEGETLKTSYDAQIFDKDGKAVGEPFTVKDKGTFNLKADQSIKIYGLDSDTEYTVTESNMPKGFKQTAPVDGESAQSATGEIAAGETSKAEFTNTYKAEPPVNVANAFAVKKNFNGWTEDSLKETFEDDEFKFDLEAEDNAPLPADAKDSHCEVTLGKDSNLKKFGEIEFENPGEYEYVLTELQDNPIKGVSYSNAVFNITVTVTDNNGKLEAAVDMKRVADDDGVEIANGGEPIAEVDGIKVAEFTNTFSSESIKFSPAGLKRYTDYTGNNPLKTDMFTFEIERDDKNAPFPEKAGDKLTYTVNNLEDFIEFDVAEFTQENLNKTYSYYISEVIPKGAEYDDENHTAKYQGMTYDTNKYKVEMAVTMDDDKVIVVTPTYYKLTGIEESNNKEIYTELSQDDLDRFAFTEKEKNEFYEGKAIAFLNSYRATPVELTGTTAIKGEKTITGRDMKDGEKFEFSLSAADDGGITAKAIEEKVIVIPEDSASATVEDAKNDVAETFAFDNITFNKPGAYKFNIKEELGGKTDSEGMTYDKHITEVTVTVTDDQGVLKAVTTYNNKFENAPTDKAVFVNKYSSSLTYGGLEVRKKLDGRIMKLGEFEFTITPKEGTPELNDADKKFKNDDTPVSGVENIMKKLTSLKFTQADAGKTFEYIVDEVEPQVEPDQPGNGVTYDKSQYAVSIKVIDNGNGTIDTETTVKKIMNEEGDLVTDDNVKVYNSADGKAPYVDFNNKYMTRDVTVTTAQAKFQKSLVGRQWQDTDKFSFKIENTVKPSGVETAPMPAEDTVVVGKPADGNSAEFSFGDITFSKPGEYEYEITEVVPEDADKKPGIKYDGHEATLIVEVTDNLKGGLTAAVKVLNGEFKNQYTATDLNFNNACSFVVTKVLNGRDMVDEQFEFLVKPVGKNNEEIAAAANKLDIPEDGLVFHSNPGRDGEVVEMFAHQAMPLVLEHADVGKTYKYEFSETSTDGNGYTCDTTKYTFAVTASDNGDGTLSAHAVVEMTEGGNTKKIFDNTVSENTPAEKGIVIDFVNSYATNPVSVDINATKEMLNKTFPENTFKFAVAGNKADGVTEDILTAGNGADGSVSFGKLTYDKASLKKALDDGYATKIMDEEGKEIYTVRYRAYEKTDNLPVGVTSREASFDFTVTAVDDGNGKLTATVNYPEDGAKFVNVYNPGEIPVSIAPNGSKILAKDDGITGPDIAGKFTFKIEAVTPGAPMPENYTAANDAEGNIQFEKIVFSPDNLKDVEAGVDGSRTKTFEYKVTESGEVAGIVNDPESVKTFTITLKETVKKAESEGEEDEIHLTATLNTPDGKPAFTFVNTYDVKSIESSITDSIDITKKLTGRELNENEFTFELVEDEKTVATAKNKSDGSVSFEKITYDKPGTHNYTVREVKGDTNTGITYDEKVFAVKTTVSDDGAGKLSVKHELVNDDAKDIAFNNTYKANGTSVTLGAAKRLDGKDLKDGQFTFRLKDESGKVISEAKNDANGAIVFDSISYDKAGEYDYTISEVNDKQDGIKYDSKEKAVKVIVTDSGEGYLEAEVKGSDDTIFTNVYTPTDNGVTDNDGGKDNNDNDSASKTGDSSNMGIFVLMAVLAAIVGGVVLTRRKRQN